MIFSFSQKQILWRGCVIKRRLRDYFFLCGGCGDGGGREGGREEGEGGLTNERPGNWSCDHVTE